MQFLIRDDDACALTRPDEIERCYGRFWDEIPVGLSVTPFRIPDKPGHGMPETLSRLDEPHPLGDNSEMVSFLREQIAAGRIFVALHGYHHARVEGQPEYVGGQDLARKTREGRTYLEDLLDCSIHTFVPPNNAVGEAGFAAVVGAGLNLVNNQTYPLSFFQAAGPRARLNQALDLQASCEKAGPVPKLQQVALTGYMIPLRWDENRVPHFMLVRDLLQCCFGGSPEPDEWVDVDMAPEGTTYWAYVPVVVRGTFKLAGQSDEAGYATGAFAIKATGAREE